MRKNSFLTTSDSATELAADWTADSYSKFQNCFQVGDSQSAVTLLRRMPLREKTFRRRKSHFVILNLTVVAIFTKYGLEESQRTFGNMIVIMIFESTILTNDPSKPVRFCYVNSIYAFYSCQRFFVNSMIVPCKFGKIIYFECSQDVCKVHAYYDLRRNQLPIC